MASSGDGGRELVVSGHGEPAALVVSGHGEPAALAVAVSGHGERAAVEVSSQGKGMLLDSLDYPCTARLRFRRLLAYLREYSCDQIYYVARDRLGVIFHVEDLVEQVKAGKFREAYSDVRVFAPILQSSDEAELLVFFLKDLMAISSFAEGDIMVAGIVCDWFKNLYKHPLLSKYPCFASLVADVLFLRSHHVRNSLDWQLVRNKAAELVEEMAYKAPELRDATHYPRGQNSLYDVMPIRSSYHRRRQLKNRGQKQSADVAQFYLQLKKRLPSVQAACHDRSGSRNQGEMLIALLDKALQAGKRKEVIFTYQCHPPEYLLKGVFPLEAVLDYKSIPGHLRELVDRLEQTSNQAMKRPMFQEPQGDTANQGNDLKRPRTTGICMKSSTLKKLHVSNGAPIFPTKALEPPPGHMDVVAVLNSRRSMSILVDALVRSVPVLEFAMQAKGSLEAILECCKCSMTPVLTRMVYAPAVLQALGTMKGALSVLETRLLVTRQETLNLFTCINQEVDALENLCLQAMNPSLPSIAPHILDANHSQPHGLSPPNQQHLSGAGYGQHHDEVVAPAPSQVTQVHNQSAAW